jgi:hypothetical protein
VATAVTEAMGLTTLDPQLDATLVADFIRFCVRKRGCWPVFPITMDKLFRFFVFLRARGALGKGKTNEWTAALRWKRAIVRYALPWQRDPFEIVGEALVDSLRKRFKNSEQRTVSIAVKLCITLDLFLAIWTALSDDIPDEKVQRTLYLVYWLTGFRAATLVLGSDKRKWKRIVRMRHLTFIPNRRAPVRVLILLPCTKTTKEFEPMVHTLVEPAHPEIGMNGVRRLRDHYEERLAQGANAEDPVFINPRSSKAYSRNVMTARLKALINRLASRSVGGRRIAGEPADYFSGVSFRKSVLQRLKDQNVSATRIASYAHHRSLSSQMSYVAENFESAQNLQPALYHGLS